jgi:hypothetical protein
MGAFAMSVHPTDFSRLTCRDSQPRLAGATTLALITIIVLVLISMVRAQTQPATPVPVAGVAQPPAIPKQSIEMTINAVGDARVKAVTTFREMPEYLKDINFENRDMAAQWARFAGLREHWFKLDNLAVKFDRKAIAVTLEYVIHGFARNNGKAWEVRLADDPITLTWNVATTRYELETECEFGRIQRSVAIVAPTEIPVEVSKNPWKITYSAPEPPPVKDPTRHTADLQLDAAPTLMACLAKSYGYEKFPALWVGRSRFTNTGDGTITDFRVRFRLTEYSTDWTPWYRTSTVRPGQTVVDPYFPVLDVDKVAKIEGTRQCTMEMEYEYHLGNGQVVKDSDGRKIELAGKNARLYPRPGSDEAPFNLETHANMLCAAFVSKDDPVIRMAAGRISGQVPGGLAPMLNPEHTIEFLKQTQRFLIHNKITYQTPPADELMQDHKYGREVLQNHSGTCVDLADFYASVCEAVGVKATLVLPPAHCLMMAELPEIEIKNAESMTPEQLVAAREVNRQALLKKYPFLYRDKDRLYCPMECTAVRPGVTFEKAAMRGLEQITDPDHRPGFVEINALRMAGINPLELPEVPPNVLDSWGITAAGAGGKEKAAVVGSLVGDWRNEFDFNGQQFHVDSTFRADGTMVASVIDSRGTVLATGTGRWTLDDQGNYTVRGTVDEDATIRFPDEDTFVYVLKKTNNPTAKVGIEAVNRRRK